MQQAVMVSCRVISIYKDKKRIESIELLRGIVIIMTLDHVRDLGRAPMFFYILHIYLIHALALFAIEFTGKSWKDMILTGNDNPQLKGYGFSLAGDYLGWLAIILMLYPLCKWYDKYKTNHKEKWWLSYL